MCDGSISTMASSQNQLRHCWIVYSQSQSNERLLASESISNTIASTSNNTRSFIGNAFNTTNSTFRQAPKIPKENLDGSEPTKSEKSTGVDDEDLTSLLEPHLRPPPPDPRSDLSKQIFDEHKQLAKEYLKIHTEIAYVTKHRDEILSRMDPQEKQERLEICKRLMEKDELLKFQANQKRQLELIRINTRPPPNNVPTASTMPTVPQLNRQNSNSSVTANEDGWVLVPSQTESDA